jgi:hypothetical protein
MRRSVVFVFLVSLVITLSSCQRFASIYSVSSLVHKTTRKEIQGTTALAFSSAGDYFDLATADVVVVNPVRSSNMTVVTFIVKSSKNLARLNAFFKRHQGQQVNVSLGQDRMKVKMLVHKPLQHGRFKIYIKNSDQYSLRFIDNVLVKHLHLS